MGKCCFLFLNVAGRVQFDSSLTRRWWAQSNDRAAGDLPGEPLSSYRLHGHANIADTVSGSFSGYHTEAQQHQEGDSAQGAGASQ